MKGKKLCELTDREMAFVESLRRGKIVLNGRQWIEVSEKEREVIEIMRAGEYGEMLIRFMEGEPKVSRVILNFLHGKLTERQAALELMPRLQEKYEEETLLLQ